METELSRFRLPVSGREVRLRHPTGAEDLLLLEAAGGASGDATLALTLAGRLSADHSVDWASACVTDLDSLILRLRQALLGDQIRADMICTSAGCGRRIDIDFGVEQFLAHHRPRTNALRRRHESCVPAEEPGWFCLTRGEERVHFRLPTVADQLLATSHAEPADELARRCLRPPEVAARLRRRAEAAMEALAPSLAADLAGMCPECGAAVTLFFDARWFCLRELRQQAAFIYQDVNVLARRYHWSETEILAMPQARRAAYAELARSSGEV